MLAYLDCAVRVQQQDALEREHLAHEAVARRAEMRQDLRRQVEPVQDVLDLRHAVQRPANRAAEQPSNNTCQVIIIIIIIL